MFLCIPHQSLMMRQSSPRITARKDALLKNAVSASPHDSQETARLDEYSERSIVVDDRVSPTQASQVLALTWQHDMWLHVAYGVYNSSNLVKLHVLFCLVYTLYLLMGHAFLFFFTTI